MTTKIYFKVVHNLFTRRHCSDADDEDNTIICVDDVIVLLPYFPRSGDAIV